MLFKNITILNEDFEVEDNMYVGIKGDRIDYIGKEEPAEDYGESYDGKERVLMPGFYNIHAHSPMALMRGYGENLVLQDWLTKRIFPFEDKLTGEAVYWGTMLCMAESLKFGIVSTSDMYYFVENMVQAMSEAGVKANIARAIVNPMGEDFDKLESVKEFKHAVDTFQGYADGRIIMDASIHGEYTSNEETVRAVAAYSKEKNLINHVHISETKLEHEECKQRHNGMTPVQYFNDCGFFDQKTLAAHCVWCDADDRAILKEKGVTVASNPLSNLKLSSGICDVTSMFRDGVKVGIGTDSVASNNSLNFIEEIKAFATLAKTQSWDCTSVTPAEALIAATRTGAQAQGRYDCGVIKTGNKADLIAIRTDVPNMHPIHDIRNNIVYSASGNDIAMTMVDGKVLYENGEYKTIDIERTMFETDKATAAILARL